MRKKRLKDGILLHAIDCNFHTGHTIGYGPVGIEGQRRLEIRPLAWPYQKK